MTGHVDLDAGAIGEPFRRTLSAADNECVIGQITNAWNEFLFSLVLTTDNARTVTPYIGGFITDKAILWGRLYASSAIIMIPVLVFGLAVQKQLAHGLTGGAVKG